MKSYFRHFRSQAKHERYSASDARVRIEDKVLTELKGWLLELPQTTEKHGCRYEYANESSPYSLWF